MKKVSDASFAPYYTSQRPKMVSPKRHIKLLIGILPLKSSEWRLFSRFETLQITARTY